MVRLHYFFPPSYLGDPGKRYEYRTTDSGVSGVWKIPLKDCVTKL